VDRVTAIFLAVGTAERKGELDSIRGGEVLEAYLREKGGVSYHPRIGGSERKGEGPYRTEKLSETCALEQEMTQKKKRGGDQKTELWEKDGDGLRRSLVDPAVRRGSPHILPPNQAKARRHSLSKQGRLFGHPEDSPWGRFKKRPLWNNWGYHTMTRSLGGGGEKSRKVEETQSCPISQQHSEQHSVSVRGVEVGGGDFQDPEENSGEGQTIEKSVRTESKREKRLRP